MLAYLSSYEDLIRLAVFMGLGLVFWGLSMAFPLDGMAIQRIRFFDAWFIFVALALAGVAEAVLLPLVILMQQEVTLAMRYWQFQDITWNSPVKLLCYLVCVDFFSYWIHRLMHSKALWSCHAFHHSPRAINWLSGARGSPLHMVLIVLPGLVFSTLFFIKDNAFVFYLVVFIEVASQHLTHTNLKLPFERQLEWFLVTPRMHFIHHNYNKAYGDRNFGSYFSIWDHLFGTYVDAATVPDKERLGLDKEFTLSSLFLGIKLIEAANETQS